MLKTKILRSRIAFFIAFAFLINSLSCPCAVAEGLFLPAPGVMVHLSPEFNPPILKGIKIHPEDPFQFDFILDHGDDRSFARKGDEKQEVTKLIKYFLASLTIPENDLWVNLSPYEKNRIIPNSFGLTEMGRDLLAEDYMLKQITASLIYPEDEIGKKFWKRIYEEAQKKFGTTNIPVNTFNKVWIVPDEAVVYENVKAGTAYVVDSKLKVMLEQDYLSLEKHSVLLPSVIRNDVSSLGANIVREIVIPELTKEVNENKNFSQLRQVYNSLILAAWYKKKIKDSILEQVYADKNKTAGVQYDHSVIPSISPQNDTQRIYQRYLQAFKKGVYNYIKEDIDPATQQPIPRKYFSGGTTFVPDALGPALKETTDPASISQSDQGNAEVVRIELDTAVSEGGNEMGRMLFGGLGHVGILEKMLRTAVRNGLTNFMSAPQDPDIFIKFFKDRKVLNIGPQNYTPTGHLFPKNIMTFLRKRGINAFALSPEKPHDEWKQWFIRGIVQKMPIEDDAYDDIISVGLFEPAFFENVLINKGNPEEIYTTIARELKRVLRDQGRLYIDTAAENPVLKNALRKEKFDIEDVGKDAWACVNHKEKKDKVQVELEEFGFNFNGGIVQWDAKNNKHPQWKPQTEWTPSNKTVKIRSMEALPSIEIEHMVPFVTATHSLFLTIATIEGSRQPIVLKQYLDSQKEPKPKYYVAMAFVPGKSLTRQKMDLLLAERKLSPEIKAKDREIRNYFAVQHHTHFPEEYILTISGNLVPIDAEKLYFEDGRETPNEEALQDDVYSQMGGPKIYGLVAGDAAMGMAQGVTVVTLSVLAAWSIIKPWLLRFRSKGGPNGTKSQEMVLSEDLKKALPAYVPRLRSIMVQGEKFATDMTQPGFVEFKQEREALFTEIYERSHIIVIPMENELGIFQAVSEELRQKLEPQEIKSLEDFAFHYMMFLLNNGDEDANFDLLQKNLLWRQYGMSGKYHLTIYFGFPARGFFIRKEEDEKVVLQNGQGEISVYEAGRISFFLSELSSWEQSQLLEELLELAQRNETEPVKLKSLNGLRVQEDTLVDAVLFNLDPQFDAAVRGFALLPNVRRFILAAIRIDGNRIKFNPNPFDMAMDTKLEDHRQARQDGPGGIDLTPANMNLQTRDDKGTMVQNAIGIKFHLDPAQFAQLQNAPGFYPRVLSVEPLNDLRQFLGISEGNVLPAVPSGM